VNCALGGEFAVFELVPHKKTAAEFHRIEITFKRLESPLCLLSSFCAQRKLSRKTWRWMCSPIFDEVIDCIL